MAGSRDSESSPAQPITVASSAQCFLYSESQPTIHLRKIADAKSALDDALGGPGTSPFLWVEISGPTEQDLAELAAHFDLPPLALEDAAEARQRPKFEHYGTTDFMVLRPIESAPARSDDAQRAPAAIDVQVGELHVFIGDAFIIFISHTASVDLDAVRRAFEGDRRFFEIPQLAAVYRVLDEVVDGYEPLLSALEDYANTLEERIFGTGPVPSQDVYRLSRELIELDRAVSPLRGMMPVLRETLDRRRPPDDLLRGVRDVADHVHSAIERLERLRTVAREIFAVNATVIAEQQSEHMQKISAWAGIFFFPTLVSGIYGMNFIHMPEIHWLLGYPLAIVMMLAGSFLLYLVFKRARWL